MGPRSRLASPWRRSSLQLGCQRRVRGFPRALRAFAEVDFGYEGRRSGQAKAASCARGLRALARAPRRCGIAAASAASEP